MEDKRLLVIDEEGNEIEMEIMFTFDYNQKNFVVYFNPSQEGEEIDVFSSIYDENGNLYPIESEEEWKVVEEMIESFTDEEEENI